MQKIMLVNVVEPEECRIAILENGRLQELYVERASQESLVGNIYKGCVKNVSQNMQAAFVDIGLPKTGFLHASDTFAPPHSRRPVPRSRNRPETRTPGSGPPPIHELLSVNREILVQVKRDEMGEKGPSLTTRLSIPGRFLVLVPGQSGWGISRKIADENVYLALRDRVRDIRTPANVGFILRTQGATASRAELMKDMRDLLRIWRAMLHRAQALRPPALVFRETDLPTRALRDFLSPDIAEVFIDSKEDFQRIRDMLRNSGQRLLEKIKFYDGTTPLFHHFRVEEEIEKIFERSVPLPSGGSITLDETEALLSIDVNSGRFPRQMSPEEMAYRTNIEAAKEIARQVRLRDIGGLIVIDFIDMKDPAHRKEVERDLRKSLSSDRAQHRMLPMSAFCLVQITRQKIRPSIVQSTLEKCPTCSGTGLIKTVESMSLAAIRKIRLAITDARVATIEAIVNPEVASYLQNVRRRELLHLEEKYGKSIIVKSDRNFDIQRTEFTLYSKSGERLDQPSKQ